MSHKYDKFRENFKKLVAKDKAKPPVFADKEKQMWPDDDDQAVNEYLNTSHKEE